jgi:hypothetical protein
MSNALNGRSVSISGAKGLQHFKGWLPKVMSETRRKGLESNTFRRSGKMNVARVLACTQESTEEALLLTPVSEVEVSLKAASGQGGKDKMF